MCRADALLGGSVDFFCVYEAQAGFSGRGCRDARGAAAAPISGHVVHLALPVALEGSFPDQFRL